MEQNTYEVNRIANNIKEVPLIKEEIRRLRKVTTARAILFFLVIFPSFLGVSYITYLAFRSFIDGDSDIWSYIVLACYLLILFMGNKYILTFYRNSFKYRGLYVKNVVEAKVLSVQERYTTKIGFRVAVRTDYMMIDTTETVIMLPGVNLFQLKAGMTIYIHVLPGVKMEVLKITDHSEE